MTLPPYPCLWLNENGAEVARYYCSVFRNSRVLSSNNMVTLLEINGSRLMVLNGRPTTEFLDSVSLVIECEDQREIDHYWDTLTVDGGTELMCGWLKDKFGMSWQIVPGTLGELLNGDPARAQRVMNVLLKMKKLIIQELESA